MAFVLKEGENLVTYYVLPMVGVNNVVFGNLFRNSLLAKDGTRVYVQLKKKMNSVGYTKVDSYITDLNISGKLYAVYNVPSKFDEEIQLFLKGKYSQFKPSTKKIIYAGSGLPYNKKVGDFKLSSPILQALDKTKVLRFYLLKTLGVDTLPNSSELIDVPEDSWFIENQ